MVNIANNCSSLTLLAFVLEVVDAIAEERVHLRTPFYPTDAPCCVHLENNNGLEELIVNISCPPASRNKVLKCEIISKAGQTGPVVIPIDNDKARIVARKVLRYCPVQFLLEDWTAKLANGYDNTPVTMGSSPISHKSAVDTILAKTLKDHAEGVIPRREAKTIYTDHEHKHTLHPAAKGMRVSILPKRYERAHTINGILYWGPLVTDICSAVERGEITEEEKRSILESIRNNTK